MGCRQGSPVGGWKGAVIILVGPNKNPLKIENHWLQMLFLIENITNWGTNNHRYLSRDRVAFPPCGLAPRFQVSSHSECLWHLRWPERSEFVGEVLM